MTVVDGMATLDCRLVDHTDSSSGATLQTDEIDGFYAKVELTMGPLVGYSVNTPGYRVWDPFSHKVWDVRGPDFDELVAGIWWKKPAATL